MLDAGNALTFRLATVFGMSPRMRLDLVVNTMFRTATHDNVLRVNNPSIWRPILAMQDAVAAYIRAVECSHEISGLFNVASGNFTLGELADYVDDALRNLLGIRARLEILHIADIRNYKVSTERAQNILSFKPRSTIVDIVRDLVEHRADFEDVDNPAYYNIATFKNLNLAVPV